MASFAGSLSKTLSPENLLLLISAQCQTVRRSELSVSYAARVGLREKNYKGLPWYLRVTFGNAFQFGACTQSGKYIARDVNPQESVPERSLSSPYEITYLIAVLRRQIAVWCCELKAM